MIISIILKNLKMILRSPSTILLLILAPMILMFLIGLAYNSVGNLTKTQVGYFGTESNYFSNLGVDFISYNGKSILESEESCKHDLKKGYLELCIFMQVQEENDKLKSAQLIYIRDNTRSTIGNILISAFERELGKITDEISSTTISGILGEVDSTLIFMNETKGLISDVENSLNQLDQNINENDFEIKTTLDTLKRTLPEALEVISTLNENLNEINSQSLDSIENSLNSLSNLENSLEEFEEILENIEESIEDSFGFVPEETRDQLNSANSIINDMQNNLALSQRNLEEVREVIDDLDIENSIESLNSLEELIREFIPIVNTLDSQYSQLKSALQDTKEEVSNRKLQVDEKYNYFNDLSNQDSNTIVKPISTEIKPLFSKFSRVHELAPTIVVTIMLFIGLLLSNVIVSMEMNSKAYFRNIISPIHQTSFIIGLFFTSLIIILFQLFFFFIILQFVFNVPTFGILDPSIMMFSKIIFWDTLLISIHLLVIFILLGMTFSLFFSSMQISILVTTFTMLFLFLLSDIILPLELMPQFFHDLLRYNPVVIGQNLFRELFFFSDIYKFDFLKFFPFYSYTLVLILFIWIGKNVKKRQLLN